MKFYFTSVNLIIFDLQFYLDIYMLQLGLLYIEDRLIRSVIMLNIFTTFSPSRVSCWSRAGSVLVVSGHRQWQAPILPCSSSVTPGHPVLSSDCDHGRVEQCGACQWLNTDHQDQWDQTAGSVNTVNTETIEMLSQHFIIQRDSFI